MAKRRNKGAERQTAARRIGILLGRARAETLGPDADLADRYAGLARRVAMRYQLRMRPVERSQVCRSCGAYRAAGATRVRIARGRIATTCLRCGAVHRRPLRRNHGQQETT